MKCTGMIILLSARGGRAPAHDHKCTIEYRSPPSHVRRMIGYCIPTGLQQHRCQRPQSLCWMGQQRRRRQPAIFCGCCLASV